MSKGNVKASRGSKHYSLGSTAAWACIKATPGIHLPLPTSPHHLRTQARATAGSALKMETGMALSLVGAFSGLQGDYGGQMAGWWTRDGRWVVRR